MPYSRQAVGCKNRAFQISTLWHRWLTHLQRVAAHTRPSSRPRLHRSEVRGWQTVCWWHQWLKCCMPDKKKYPAPYQWPGRTKLRRQRCSRITPHIPSQASWTLSNKAHQAVAAREWCKTSTRWYQTHRGSCQRNRRSHWPNNMTKRKNRRIND